MERTNKTKKIFGRNIPIVEVETIKKEVKSFGKGGGHITVPQKYEGSIAEITFLGLAPFTCKKCYEHFNRENHFSPVRDMCRYCYAEKQAMDKNKCISCGGENPKAEQWALCNECFKDGDRDENNYILDEDKTEDSSQ